jgi:CRP-like cAMP-binding protein
VVLWHRLRTLDDMSRASPALVSLLAGIPIFAPLSDAALDRLATSLRMVSVPAGTTVFEQGDDGDAFYAIEEGTADVLIDGSVVRTLSAGGYFGEIALLRNVPRTATILALTDLRLQRLERNRFLETVMGSSASTHAANAVVGARLGLRAELTTV